MTGEGASSRRAFLRGHGSRPEREPDRYSSQLGAAEWSEAAQAALREASVLVAGAGALGSPVAAYLAAAGVGRLGIADDAAVELAGLHRQHLHFTPDLGLPKAASAAAKLGFLNPEIVVEPYRVRVEDANAAGLVAGNDLVVDCTGSVSARDALNAACCAAGIALVIGALSGTDGLVMAIRPGETACYRCVFPESAAAPDGAGVLGPAAGVVGSLAALEALRMLAGAGRALAGAYLRVDLASLELRRVPAGRLADCPDCGTRTL